MKISFFSGPYVGSYNILYMTASTNYRIVSGFSINYRLLPC